MKIAEVAWALFSLPQAATARADKPARNACLSIARTAREDKKSGGPGLVHRGVSRAVLPLCLILLAWVLSASGASVTAVLERDVIALGEATTLRVVIEGGSGNETPEIPGVPGLRFQQASQQTSFSFINGRQSVMLEIGYVVSASRVGEFTIPPVKATAGARQLQSQPVTLRVVRPGDPAAARSDGLDKAAFLVLDLPRTNFYVGETFVATVWLYAL